MYGGRTLTSIWVTFGPVILFNVFILITMAWFGIALMRNKIPSSAVPESAHRNKSVFLNTFLREWWVWMTDPIAKFFVKIGWGPNILTFIGFALSVIAGFFFAYGYFGYAGWAMVFGATFDIFDGRVARISGKETKSGAFLDSVMDRFSEGVVFIGLAYFFKNSFILPFIVLGLIGSMVVSYTRAKGEASGVVCKGGSMQRPERIVYIGVSSILTPFADIILIKWWSAPAPIIVMIAIIIVAVMTNFTSIYRMIYIINKLDKKENGEEKPITQMLGKLTSASGREELWQQAKFGYDRKQAKASPFMLILVPGWNAEIYSKLSKDEKLPEIKKLKSQGSKGEVIASFPASFGSAEIPFVTGCYPGSADVPGSRWYAKKLIKGDGVINLGRFRDYKGWGGYAIDYDLLPSAKTLFEYSKKATSIFGLVNRGCGIVRDPAFFQMRNLLFDSSLPYDKNRTEKTEIAWIKKALDKGTDAIVCTFPTLMKATDDKELQDAYIRLNSFLEEIHNILSEKHLAKKAVIALAPTWQTTKAEKYFDLSEFLSKRFESAVVDNRPKVIGTEAIGLTSGGGMAHIYVRKDAFKKPSFLEDLELTGLIGAMLENKEIALLAGRSKEGGIIVVNRKGRIKLREDADGRITCITTDGNPFCSEGFPQVTDESTEFERTLTGEYPDALVQLLQIFRSQRTGDIVISAEPNVSFTEEEKYTYGSLHEFHRRLPIFTNFDLPTKYMRSVDVFTLLANYMGIKPNHKLDSSWTFNNTESERNCETAS